MENIKNIEKYVDSNIAAYEGLQESTRMILEGLKQMRIALVSPAFKNELSFPFPSNSEVESELATTAKTEERRPEILSASPIKNQYADYPHTGKFADKIRYLDFKVYWHDIIQKSNSFLF